MAPYCPLREPWPVLSLLASGSWAKGSQVQGPKLACIEPRASHLRTTLRFKNKQA